MCFSQVINHELGSGGVEGWTSRKSPAEDPGDGSPAGQTEEREDTEAVSAGLIRSCPTKTETKGQHLIYYECINQCVRMIKIIQFSEEAAH